MREELIAVNTDLSNALDYLGSGSNIIKSISSAYSSYKQNQVSQFLKYADFTMDRLSLDNVNIIQDMVSSEEGRIVLCKFLEKSIVIDSDIARMILAILFSQDPDFIFKSHIKNILFIAIKELDDRAINFYIDAHNKVNKYKIDGLPYERVVINKESELLTEEWSSEEIALLVGHFRKLNLLLPDPCSSSPYVGKDSTWLVEYGISDTTRKISRLFQKAKELSKEYGQQA